MGNLLPIPEVRGQPSALRAPNSVLFGQVAGNILCSVGRHQTHQERSGQARCVFLQSRSLTIFTSPRGSIHPTCSTTRFENLRATSPPRPRDESIAWDALLSRASDFPTRTSRGPFPRDASKQCIRRREKASARCASLFPELRKRGRHCSPGAGRPAGPVVQILQATDAQSHAGTREESWRANKSGPPSFSRSLIPRSTQRPRSMSGAVFNLYH